MDGGNLHATDARPLLSNLSCFYYGSMITDIDVETKNLAARSIISILKEIRN